MRRAPEKLGVNRSIYSVRGLRTVVCSCNRAYGNKQLHALASIADRYFVPRVSHRAAVSSACPGRERLMEQPVSSGHTLSRETETQVTCWSYEDLFRAIDAGIISISMMNPTRQVDVRQCLLKGGVGAISLKPEQIAVSPSELLAHGSPRPNAVRQWVTYSDKPKTEQGSARERGESYIAGWHARR